MVWSCSARDGVKEEGKSDRTMPAHLTWLVAREARLDLSRSGERIAFARRLVELDDDAYARFQRRDLCEATRDAAHLAGDCAGFVASTPRALRRQRGRVLGEARERAAPLPIRDAPDDVEAAWKEYVAGSRSRCEALRAGLLPLLSAWEDATATLRKEVEERADTGSYSEYSSYSDSDSDDDDEDEDEEDDDDDDDDEDEEDDDDDEEEDDDA
jgi:hypothetical protein